MSGLWWKKVFREFLNTVVGAANSLLILFLENITFTISVPSQELIRLPKDLLSFPVF